ncbi:MAG: hypothetical protein LBO06_04490 [Bacteroidales bacterium]|jgi:hypothetical protein|nr:hypothetical protein [Bacteroidales bacterium]
MPKHKYTREQYFARKEQRKEIYKIIFEFVELSDDYWISFKKLRRVLKHVDDAQIFFAPYVSKNGKFNAKKLEAFQAVIDKEYEVIMANRPVETPAPKAKRAAIVSNVPEGAPVKKVRRVRLSEEQIKALEKLKSEKQKATDNQ